MIEIVIGSSRNNVLDLKLNQNACSASPKLFGRKEAEVVAGEIVCF